jgi:hypothetical protein
LFPLPLRCILFFHSEAVLPCWKMLFFLSKQKQYPDIECKFTLVTKYCSTSVAEYPMAPSLVCSLNIQEIKFWWWQFFWNVFPHGRMLYRSCEQCLIPCFF